MSRWIGLALLLVVVGALALRLPDLDRRPMHNDEAVNAHLIQKLWEDGLYNYNPDEYHGPTLHYATLPLIWLSGAKDFTEVNESILRLGTVIFGVLLILLLWWLADGLARSALVYAAILTAVSPAMVFYSRYFIHEMLLVVFQHGSYWGRLALYNDEASAVGGSDRGFGRLDVCDQGDVCHCARGDGVGGRVGDGLGTVLFEGPRCGTGVLELEP